jgi:hypothetical protein
MSEADGIMARRGVIGLLTAAASALVLGGCGLFDREESYRFRMTVEVETPKGVKRGSSVLEEVASLSSIRIGDSTGKRALTRGEAAVVDLPDGPIFVLLSLPDAGGPLGGKATVALAPEARGGDRSAFIEAVGELGEFSGNAKAELPRGHWPLMVRFRNLDDPKSVERVDPETTGVKRILLETTNDDITIGIDKRLGWLSTKFSFFDPSSENGYFIPQGELNVAHKLSVRDFSSKFGK